MRITEVGWFVKGRAAIHTASEWFERVGLVALAAMGLATLVDVIGSKVFNLPLPGSTEITGVIQILAIAGGLAFSKIDGSQIRVDIIFEWLPRRGQAVIDVFSAILGLFFSAVAAWMSFEHGLSLLDGGTRTFLLGIPLSPFAFWIAASWVPMGCVIISELLTAIDGMVR